MVRERTRLRIALPPLPAHVPLGGWLFLHWDAPLTLTRVAPPELLMRLAARRSWKHLPTDPATMLPLATLPAWDLTRPHSWSALGPTCHLLIDKLDGSR